MVRSVQSTSNKASTDNETPVVYVVDDDESIRFILQSLILDVHPRRPWRTWTGHEKDGFALPSRSRQESRGAGHRTFFHTDRAPEQSALLVQRRNCGRWPDVRHDSLDPRRVLRGYANRVDFVLACDTGP